MVVCMCWQIYWKYRDTARYVYDEGNVYLCGPIELFLVPASAPRLVYQRLWYVLSCLWDGAYKRTLAANR